MLRVLFGAPFGADLVFKGGTSLAKAYDAIRHETRPVACDATPHLPDIVFPAASPSVMSRTTFCPGLFSSNAEAAVFMAPPSAVPRLEIDSGPALSTNVRAVE